LENGNLVIYPVSRDDEGLYTCTATNILGLDESRGRLIVLRKFPITFITFINIFKMSDIYINFCDLFKIINHTKL